MQIAIFARAPVAGAARPIDRTARRSGAARVTKHGPCAIDNALRAALSPSPLDCG